MQNKDNQGFLLGLAIGVAAVSFVGFLVMSVAFLNKSEIADVDDGDSNKVADVKAPTPTSPPAPGAKVDVKYSDDDYSRGAENAKVTIVEFSDIQCPFCKRFHDTLRQIIKAYPNDVKWVYKNFPLDSLHPYARKAAEAAECAGEQGKFWEFVDTLYDNQRSINLDYLNTAAKNVGLKTSSFKSCFESGKYSNKVNSDFNEGRRIGVTGTPGSVLNGQLIKGALPFESIKQMVEEELAK